MKLLAAVDVEAALAEAARELTQRGLRVTPRFEALVVGFTQEGGPVATLARVREHWELSTWVTRPGPEPDEGEARTDDLRVALAWIRAWSAGDVTLVGDWRVPLHLHPAWDVRAVERALVGAERVERSLFADEQRVAIEDHVLHQRSGAWRKLFVGVAHRLSSGDILWLRRDLGRALITPRRATDLCAVDVAARKRKAAQR